MWLIDPPYGEVDPRSLGLSEELIGELWEWAGEYETGLNWSDPASSPGVESPERFDSRGQELAKRIVAEQPSLQLVQIYSETVGKLVDVQA